MKTKKAFLFDPEQEEYLIELQKRRWWLLLLLLLPLFLFLKFDRTVHFQISDKENGALLDSVELMLSYTEENSQIRSVTDLSDEDGLVHFAIERQWLFQILFGTEKNIPLHIESFSACYTDTVFDSDSETISNESPYPIRLSKQANNITIKVVSQNDSSFVISNANVQLELIGQNGGANKIYTTTSNSDGLAHFDKLPFCNGNLKLSASHDNYYPYSLPNRSISDVLSIEEYRIIPLKPINYTLDIVMCIDATGSMDNLISSVKSNALSFYEDLSQAMIRKDKAAKTIRVRVIAYRDYYSSGVPMYESRFFTLPEEEKDYSKAVTTIRADGGGDEPESGLEALALAIKSDWSTDGENKRQIIVLWTDATAHSLEKRAGSKPASYPTDLPKNFTELSQWWSKISNTARFVIYAPEKIQPWAKISSEWTNINYYPSSAGYGLRDVNYQAILDAIAEGI